MSFKNVTVSSFRRTLRGVIRRPNGIDLLLADSDFRRFERGPRGAEFVREKNAKHGFLVLVFAFLPN
jgi:hypothetical protein